MKNYEKYADEIKKYKGYDFCRNFIIPHILNSSDCNGANCFACHMRQMLWLLEEYEEPGIDWSGVKIDTPILVRDTEYEEWYRRYFAEYKDGIVYTWSNGRTSWSVNNGNEATPWRYAKLAESDD